MGDNLIDVKSLIAKPSVKEEGLVDVSSLIKKKEPTASSSLNGQSQLPLSKPLEEGKGISENSFLAKVGKNASATATPMGITELPIKEIKETEISLKPKKEAKQYYNAPLEKGLVFTDKTKILQPSSRALTGKIEKAQEIDLKKSTQKDLVEKSREMPLIEETEYPEGEWSFKNAAQQVVDKFFETAFKGGEFLALKAREMQSAEAPELFKEGKVSKYGKTVFDTERLKAEDWKKDPLGAIALGLHGMRNLTEEDIQYNRLPNTSMGSFTEDVLSFIPDVALAEAVPTAGAAAATKVGKLGNLLFNNFTKYLGIKGVAEGYVSSKEKGETSEQATLNGLKSGAIGVRDGVLFAAAGAGGNLATNATMKYLEKAGFTGAKGMTTREALNYIYDATIMGTAVPGALSVMNDKELTKDEMIKSAGYSLVFGLKRTLGNITNNADLNAKIKDIQSVKQGVAALNFADADFKTILDLQSNPLSADQLMARGLESIKKAKESTSVEEKSKLVGEAMVDIKAANVKQMTRLAIENPHFADVMQRAEIPQDVKDNIIEKATLLHENLHPENVSKNELSAKIQDLTSQKAELENVLKTEKDPIVQSEARVKLNDIENELNISNAELDKITERQLKREKPEIIEPEAEVVQTERTTGVEPELPEGGVTIVTETGLTEPERQAKIEQRRKETKISDEVVSRNQLVQEVKEFFEKGKRYRNSSEGLRKLNELRIKAREKGLEVDDKSEALVKKTGARKTKIKYNAKAEGDAIIDQNGKTLYDREKSVQDIFKELLEANGFLDVKREDGVRMSEAQMDATIQDILDGIPSKRANRYLDELETAINDNAFNVYDKGIGERQFTIEEIRDALGVEAEKVGEPMDEESLINFLDEESNLTPEEERELTDNIENLLYEYEPETGAEVEIQQPKPESKEGISTEVEQAEGAKETTAEKPTEPVEAQKEKEAPKEATLKDLYESLPKSEKLRKEAINDNIDQIISKLVTENKIKKEC